MTTHIATHSVAPQDGVLLSLLTDYADAAPMTGAVPIDAFIGFVTDFKVVEMAPLRARFPNLSPEKLADKAKAGGCLMPGLAGPPSGGRRGKVGASNLLALDVEKMTGPAPHPEAVWEKLKTLNVTCAMHSTFKSTSEAWRYRVFVLIDRTLDMAGEILKRKALTRWLAKELDVLQALDKASYSVDRLLFLPRRPDDGPVPFVRSMVVRHGDGRLRGLDPAVVDGVSFDDEPTARPPSERSAAPEPRRPGDAELIRSALAAIPNERLSREDWVKVGIIIKRELGEAGFPLWQEFSRRYPGNTDDEIVTRWHGLNVDDGRHPEHEVHVGTLVHMAEQHGWSMLADTVARLRAAVSNPPTLSEPPARRGRPRQSDRLMPAGRGMVFYKGEGTDDAYADVTTGDVRQTFALRSKAFREYLTLQSVALNNGSAMSRAAIDTVIDTFGARAASSPARPVFLRHALASDGSAWIDMGDSDWRAIHVTADGWRMVPSSDVPVRFRRSSSMLPLPEPVVVENPGAAFQEFQKVVHVDDDNLLMVAAMLTMTLSGRLPVPPLVFTGTAGSAKTGATKYCRLLVDPTRVPTRGRTRNIDDLMTAAHNNAVVAVDNISNMTEEEADAYCQITTGAGYEKRTNYSDLDVTAIHLRRAVIMNGIGNFITRGDFASRSVVAPVAFIEAKERLQEAEVDARFEGMKARLLGALLAGVAAGIRGPGRVPAELPRMADFYVWGMAVGPVFAGPDAFARVFADRTRGLAEQMLDGDPLLSAVSQLFDVTADRAMGREPRPHDIGMHQPPVPLPGEFRHGPDRRLQSWFGTAADLLILLTKLAYPTGGPPRTWPANARAMSVELERGAPSLFAALGVRVKRKQTRTVRGIELTR